MGEKHKYLNDEIFESLNKYGLKFNYRLMTSKKSSDKKFKMILSTKMDINNDRSIKLFTDLNNATMGGKSINYDGTINCIKDTNMSLERQDKR